MTPKDYLENVVLKTWDGRGTQEQCFYGFIEEFGEITGKLRKSHRDDISAEEKERLLKKELGDYIWYLTQLGYLRKTVDFSKVDFEPDNLSKKKDIFKSVLINEIKIGRLTSAIADGNSNLEKQMMNYLLKGFTQLSNSMGFEVQDILQTNKNKLFDRIARNKMQGNGDER